MSRAQDLLERLGDAIMGETVGDAYSAALTLLWLICEHAEIDITDAAAALVKGDLELRADQGSSPWAEGEA